MEWSFTENGIILSLISSITDLKCSYYSTNNIILPQTRAEGLPDFAWRIIHPLPIQEGDFFWKAINNDSAFSTK